MKTDKDKILIISDDSERSRDDVRVFEKMFGEKKEDKKKGVKMRERK